MSSAASPIRAVLEGYVAGRVKAERVVEAVAAEYYGRDAGSGMRDALRPVVEIIERAHPGVIELAGSQAQPGFAVRLAERPFPKVYEDSLRAAVVGALGAHLASRIPHPGFWARAVRAVRRFFTAST
jgi:hypothetical protein